MYSAKAIGSIALVAVIGILLWRFLPRKGSAPGVDMPAYASGAPGAHTEATAHENSFWQANYKGGSSGLTGTRPLKPITLDSVNAIGLPESLGRIMVNKDNYTRSHWFRPDGFSLVHAGAGPQGSITGDPRALYCLDLLIRKSGITGLTHVGMQVTNGGDDQTHDLGYAIDIKGGKIGAEAATAHQIMNAFIAAASAYDMPIAWCGMGNSKVNRTGDRIWPFHQLRNNQKVEYSYSRANHDDHYHLVLPRPDWSTHLLSKEQ